MSTNSNLEVLVNLGFDKEEANAVLKQGNLNNSLNTLLGNLKEKYTLYPHHSENKRTERKFESRNLRQYGTPVGLKKFPEGEFCSTPLSALLEFADADIFYAAGLC